MDEPGAHDLTQLLEAWGNGEEEALAKLAPLVHAELYRLAKRYLVTISRLFPARNF